MLEHLRRLVADGVEVLAKKLPGGAAHDVDLRPLGFKNVKRFQWIHGKAVRLAVGVIERQHTVGHRQ